MGERLGEKLNEIERKILNLIRKNKHVTIPGLAEKIDISTTAIENNIAKLKQKNLIERIGPDKGGHFEIRV